MIDLPQEVKDRVLAEEQYRVAAKNALGAEKDKKSSSALFAFLNSNFGLWILTAIFITGAGSLFTRWRDHLHEQQRQQTAAIEQQRLQAEYTERLNAEIGNRISTLLVSLDDLTDPAAENDLANGRLAKGHTPAEVKDILHRFTNGRGEEISALYPEFMNSTTLQLVTDLRRNTTGENRKQLDEIMAAMSGIDVLLGVNGASYSNPVRVASVVQKKFASYAPWRDNEFYFLDCTPGHPFC